MARSGRTEAKNLPASKMFKLYRAVVVFEAEQDVRLSTWPYPVVQKGTRHEQVFGPYQDEGTALSQVTRASNGKLGPPHHRSVSARVEVTDTYWTEVW